MPPKDGTSDHASQPVVPPPASNAAEYRAQLEQSGSPQDLIEFLVDEFEAALKRPPVTDADSTLANQPENGTHSIIDIVAGVSAVPRLFTVPLGPEQLRNEFGTERPDVDTAAVLRYDLNGADDVSVELLEVLCGRNP